MSPYPIQKHQTEIFVVGGGLAGMLAAISAARHGAKVVLMHDRPVLGGNCSSEIRVGVGMPRKKQPGNWNSGRNPAGKHVPQPYAQFFYLGQYFIRKGQAGTQYYPAAELYLQSGCHGAKSHSQRYRLATDHIYLA